MKNSYKHSIQRLHDIVERILHSLILKRWRIYGAIYEKHKYYTYVEHFGPVSFLFQVQLSKNSSIEGRPGIYFT